MLYINDINSENIKIIIPFESKAVFSKFKNAYLGYQTINEEKDALKLTNNIIFVNEIKAYTDKELITAYDFSAKVTKSFTLYAKWEKVNDEKEENPDTHNCPSKSFDDLDVTRWYHLDVDYVLENGLMKGTDTRTFAPNDKLTRAMLVTVLYRMENEPSTNRSIPFSDVDMGAYYANAVSWAKQNGIVNGVSDTEFAPNDSITREQMAAVLYRYAQYKEQDTSIGEDTNILSYTDAMEISEYAISAIQWMTGAGLMKGETEASINPKNNSTRAQVATILMRYLEQR